MQVLRDLTVLGWYLYFFGSFEEDDQGFLSIPESIQRADQIRRRRATR